MQPTTEMKSNGIRERIREAAEQGKLSHALLFTGGGDCLSAAQYAAAAMECLAETGRPCGICAACHKVMENIHPDVITVQDSEHKNIAVDIIRDMRADAYIQPNEGKRKIYLFPDCSVLTEQDQNVLLKIVEEGPPYAAFLFCAPNSAAVLPTLRSRCVEMQVQSTDYVEESQPLSETEISLCKAIAKKRRGAVAEMAVRLEKKKMNREELDTLLCHCGDVFSVSLLSLYGKKPVPENQEIVSFLTENLTKNQLMYIVELLQKYHAELAYNVGIGHTLGALAAELEGIL